MSSSRSRSASLAAATAPAEGRAGSALPSRSHGKSRSFAPVSRETARVLVLGSLPGARSLAEQQYYAQPQNAFWRIMGALVGAGLDCEYAVRLQRLTAHGIALWDVVAAARRAGSLDSAIERRSVEVNDFAAFFYRHPSIRLICFNGKTAAQLYQRSVLPALPPATAGIERIVLPSTSPAYASMRLAGKITAWRAALAPHLGVS